ncbi:MAG TPA: alpha/beta hydrolase [Allosphingosinicella sp.]|nr:alpha/beta hydrolase [Allosphingosinicella sp.]
MKWPILLAPALGLACVGAAPPLPPTAPSAARPFAPARFSVVVQGTGPDVILIPGLTGSRDVWRGSAAAVPGYRYHLVQVAGFANTPVRGNARGEVVAPLAEEVARYISSRGLRRPAIVGHSMGGTVAMMVAARHPGLAGKVMVVDMLPQPAGILGGDAAGMRGLADSLRDLGSTPGGRRLVESAIRLFGNPEGGADPDVTARATHELALTDLTPELPRIAAPLTVVYASPDPSRRAAEDARYRAAYALKRGVRLVRVDDSGHMIMYDQPARFGAELKRFLAD